MFLHVDVTVFPLTLDNATTFTTTVTAVTWGIPVMTSSSVLTAARHKPDNLTLLVHFTNCKEQSLLNVPELLSYVYNIIFSLMDVGGLIP